MKKSTITASVLCALMMLSLLTACSGSKVRDDVAVSSVVSAIDTAIGNTDDANLVPAPESFIRGSMKMDVSDYSEYTVKINSRGINIDEYGVFKGADAEQAAAIEQSIKDYFAFRLESWMPEYMPEELPKLENAKLQVAGNYVMYAIMADDQKTPAFEAFAAALKA
ncbi:MAG: DUF4358 domain-containing protein [Oscillospiraceae bacterium]